MAQEFKMGDDERVSLIDEILQELFGNKYALNVSRNEEALLNNKHIVNTIHTYQLFGCDSSKKTQNTNLIQKIEDVYKSLSSPANQNQPDGLSQELQKEEGAQFRYFRDNVRCFRCKKVGHYNYACLYEFHCIYCLDVDHISEKCPQRTVCYQCYEYGHIVSQCTINQAAFCQDCRRKHNKKCCFLTKGIEPVKQMFNTDYLYRHENIRCIRCFQYGHLICPVGLSQRNINYPSISDS